MSHSSNGEKFTFWWEVLRELDQWFYLVNKYRTFTSYMFFSLVDFFENNLCWRVPKCLCVLQAYPSLSMLGFICFITLYAHNFPQPFESHLQALCPFSPKYLSELLKNSTFSSITIAQLSNSGNLTLAAIWSNLQSIFEFHQLAQNFLCHLFSLLAHFTIIKRMKPTFFLHLSSMVNKITNPKFKIFKNLNTGWEKS